MKILILGSRGMLGHEVTKYFTSKNNHVVDALSREEFNPLQNDVAKLAVYEYDAVINCIGIIKPMIKDLSALDVIKVNSIFPRNLAKECSENNVKCVHITTDCVFSGLEGNYDETCLFDAMDLYGLTKAAGESADAMVLRTSIIGEELNNSRSLVSWVKSQKGKEVNGYTNHRWNGVTTNTLAGIIDYILMFNLYKKGTYHVFSNEVITKCVLLEMLNDVYDLNLTIKPVAAEETCDRSLSSIYKLQASLPILTIWKQIIKMMEGGLHA